MPTSVVYRITYPNGKIYIGQDRTNSINYFGSADGRLIEADFIADQRRSFTITRDILWSSDTATRSEVSIMKNRFIREHRSNEPTIHLDHQRPIRVMTNRTITRRRRALVETTHDAVIITVWETPVDVFYAHCRACKYSGPLRLTASEAEHDGALHDNAGRRDAAAAPPAPALFYPIEKGTIKMKDDLYSEGGPVPTTAAALDTQLGQLAVAYAESVLGELHGVGWFRCRYGPWEDPRSAAVIHVTRPAERDLERVKDGHASVAFPAPIDLGSFHPCGRMRRTGPSVPQRPGRPVTRLRWSTEWSAQPSRR